jgi:gas vesicle protein
MRDMNAIKKGAKVLGAVAAGGAVGYVAGIATAPSSGPETRRRMRQRVEDEALALKDAARGAMKRVSDTAGDVARRAQCRNN